jgi:hypothetical protein
VAIARSTKTNYPDLITDTQRSPSMDALASHWGQRQRDGVHIERRLQSIGWVAARRFLFADLRVHLLGWPAFLAPDGRVSRTRGADRRSDLLFDWSILLLTGKAKVL